MAKALDVTMSACLEALDRGESIDSILSRYPEMATELRPFLETAVLAQNQAHNPTVAAKSASLTAMRKEATALRPRKRRGFALFFHRARRFSPVMALFMVMVLVGLTLSAPPTSPLHGARLFLDGFGNTPTVVAPILTPVMGETAVSPTETIPTEIVPASTARSTSESSRTPTATPTIAPSTTVTTTLTTTPTATSTLTTTPSPPPVPTADDGDDDDTEDDAEDGDEEDDSDGDDDTGVEDDELDDK